MYCTERRNLGRQLKAMKVHHHPGGHLCTSASLTQTKALQRSNPPMQQNSALISCRGRSSFALQAIWWNLSRVKKLRIYRHTIAFLSLGSWWGGQPQVTGQGPNPLRTTWISNQHPVAIRWTCPLVLPQMWGCSAQEHQTHRAVWLWCSCSFVSKGCRNVHTQKATTQGK